FYSGFPHLCSRGSIFFFFNYSSTTEIYTLSLHDALPISASTTTLTINALNLTNTGTGTVATINSGETLTLSTGAIISAGSVANTINGGNLTAGINSVTSRELILHVVSGLTVNSAIVDQSGNAVKLVKSSGGTLTLNGTNS